ncbi:membrane associated rhomboid family serine protease [Rhizobium sp. SG_E_25_P2]|uniref:rhomboid family intramembrane serine protease n=1 Tax=Rhizobium sp. SG_E_25_P2 TaxID=2879942 RepID=UPI002475FDCD|nr:rhomboid family intramembrane serine protease [Rhizobium sp. SG_E_25_P2]MDH6265077.1 membrane associated rhomboid family serine protease [Rhizobium sp. SG_E_25_P2]
MFVPIYDVNALKHIRLQYVTLGLIAINTIVWLATGFFGSEDFAAEASVGLGFIPALIHDYAVLDAELKIAPEGATFVTYAFLHGSFMHLASNMLFLWVFGDNVEDAMGHLRFILFYLLCAAAGAWLHGMVLPQSDGPLIGASGAISGVVASYFFLHPRVRVWVLILWRFPLPLPAFIPLIFWIGQQFYMLLVDADGSVSWAAHVGGIIAGLVLTPLLKRREAPLLDRQIVKPASVELADKTESDQDENKPRWGRG